MPVTATALRADIYRLLDRVLETGEPLEIERNGQLLTLSAPPRRALSARFPPRPGLIAGDPDGLAETDWSDTWQP